jgi:hypothetical protein
MFAPIRNLLTITAFALPVTIQAATTEEIQFFKEEVRPILEENCFKCHGGVDDKGHVKIRSGLQLISQKGILIGGDHGPAFDEKEPSNSRLLTMIAYGDPDKSMPPSGKLPEAQIATLVKWVKMGIPWTPEDADKLVEVHEDEGTTTVNDRTRAYWSNKPMERPEVPKIEGVRNPIDAFIKDKLTTHGLTPNGKADKRTLARRAYFNLTGLAPTPEEVEDFVNNTEPDAWPKLVDQLLDSPHYGEKWGRHWLDLVRYAESNGFERDSEKEHIWRYRDYVIDAFNQDKPYDQFIKEQLAGDELDEVTPESKIATGYHRLMQWDDEPADRLQHKYDVLDDNVRTTTEGMLAMTAGCARCHDHKGDPFPQKDYYSIMAFFHGVTDMDKSRVIENIIPKEEALRVEAGKKKMEVQKLEIRDRIGKIESMAAKALQEKVPALRDELEGAEGGDLTLIADSREKPQEWFYTFEKPADDWSSVGFRPETSGWKKGAAGFGMQVPNSVPRTEWKTKDIWIHKEFRLTKVPKKIDLTLHYDDDVEVYLNGQLIHSAKGYTTNYEVIELPKPVALTLQTGRNSLAIHCSYDGGGRYLDAGLQISGKKVNVSGHIRKHWREIFTKEQFDTYNKLNRELSELDRAPVAGEIRAMIVQESGMDPPPLHVHIRGNASSPGDQVEPGFPQIFGGLVPVIQANEKTKTSGRRKALAEWITHPKNPRTARVMVNRIWQHHFGRGICPTPSDFGYLGMEPTHPELLDWLATEFVRKKWSIKEMHRLIMNSEAYQMSSKGSALALEKDPQNDLLWRYDMRRLTAEEMRDTILYLSGQLNLAVGGESVYVPLPEEVLATSSTKGGKWGTSSPEDAARRSIYVHVKRSLKPPMLSDFDFADTDAPCPVRFNTTVPTQALNMLNSEFLNEQAAVFAVNLRETAGDDPKAQIRAAFETALSRPVTDDEISRAEEFLNVMQKDHGLSKSEALVRFCLLVLNLNEFVYLD